MNEPGPTRLRGLCEGVGRCIWVYHIVILIGAEGEGGSCTGWVSQGFIKPLLVTRSEASTRTTRPEFCFPRRCQLASLTAIKCVYIYRRHTITLIPKLYTLDLGICVISEPDAEVPESCSALEHILVEVSHRGAPPPVRTPPCRHAISGQHLLVAPITQASRCGKSSL